MKTSRLCAIGIMVSFASIAWATPPGAPMHVQAVDDPAEERGLQVIVSWQPPDEFVDLPALQPIGYRVLYRTEARTDWQRGPLVPLEMETVVLGGLKPWPWPAWEVAVAVVYEPPGRVPRLLQQVTAVEIPRSKLRSETATGVRPTGRWFNRNYVNVLAMSVLLCAIVLVTLAWVRGRAEDVYIRPIAGLEAVNDAIGRATEMGKPIVYVSGLSGIGSISTIASMLILGHLSRRSAAYETEILVPCNDPLVMSTEREIVRQAYTEAGKPDAYRPENIFFVTESQFGYVAAVDGIMLREEPAACFYMGYFFAEALILAETGNQSGAIQIAGTDADTQLPFFITACDYTLMGEELYAASAYLSRQPLLVAQLRGQDIAKAIIAAMVVAGVAAATWAAVTTGAIAEAASRFVAWFAT